MTCIQCRSSPVAMRKGAGGGGEGERLEGFNPLGNLQTKESLKDILQVHSLV